MARPLYGWICRAALVGGAMLSSGCTIDTVPLEAMTYDGVVHRQVISGKRSIVDPQPICGDKSPLAGVTDEARETVAYKVGPGDTLRFNIFGEEGMRDFTARIDAEGFVQLPIIEALKVSDRTTRQIQQLLKKKYEIRFLDAWVTVELHNAQSHPVHFLGEFRVPGVRYLERRTDLLEGIAMAGGLEEDAYLPGARLIRNERFCSINLRALLRTGDFTQNVSLIGGDLIFVPLRGDMNVYILGAVETPQAIAFGESGRSLLEVLSIAGGPDAGTALLKEVRIIRTLTPTRGELLVLDVRGMLRGERLDFELEPDDVIYVPRSALGSWNEAIRQILPSLQLLSGAIAPVALITTLAE